MTEQGSLRPLCVDLDGTLIRSDLLADGIAGLLTHPLLLLGALAALPDRAAFKARIAATGNIRVELLPYSEDLLERLRAERSQGRRLVLATAADLSLAHRVADFLGLFDEVIGSEPGRNLKGSAKAAALVERFGVGGFDYAGNSHADLPIWRQAAAAWVVNAPRDLAAVVRTTTPVVYETHAAKSFSALLSAIRPHQWSKNALVFVPIITAHAMLNGGDWVRGMAAFIAMSATASAIYLFNDLTDIEADRAHSRKRYRPFAAGTLQIPTGMMALLALLTLGLAAAITTGVGWLVLGYAALSISYSFRLKELPLVDAFVLSGLYTLRLITGGVATGHPVTLWLLAFSSFVFLGLSFMKRVDELERLDATADARVARRGYVVDDLSALQGFGVGASFASAIVLALFVQNEATVQRYAAPNLLWTIVPLMLFWQCRLWLAVGRRYMHHDPIVYAMRDWVSWAVAIATAAVLVAAKSGPPW